MSAQLRKTIKHRRKCHNNSYELQQCFLEWLADEMITAENPNQVSIIKQIKSTESTKAMYRKVKNYLKPENCTCLTQVDIPEWDKLKVWLTDTIAHSFTHLPQAQWWLTIAIIPFFFALMNWKELFISAISRKKRGSKERNGEGPICTTH
eukprot:9244556-Ditylum_brightwellii.AAC.1